MPIFDWSLMSDECRQGPKRKTLATEHLEYIVHAMLSDDRQQLIDFSIKNSELLAIVNGQQFSITKIFAAEPQFEFISLHKSHLQTYYELYRAKNCYPLAEVKYLHPAQVLAVDRYIRSYFIRINNLLRGIHLSDIKPEPRIILDICVAAHALCQYVPHKSSYPSEEVTLFRGNKTDAHINPNDAGLLTDRGFFSTSINWAVAFKFSKQKTVIEIHPNSRCQPLGLDISELSFYNGEQEVLFPPNTLFQYVQVEFNRWVARPVYRVDLPEKPYEHTFNEEDLAQIRNAHLKLIRPWKLQEVVDFLMQKQSVNNHQWSQRLFHFFYNKGNSNYLDDVIKIINSFMNRTKQPISDVELRRIIQHIVCSMTDNEEQMKQASRKTSFRHTHRVLAIALNMIEGVYEGEDVNALIHDSSPINVL